MNKGDSVVRPKQRKYDLFFMYQLKTVQLHFAPAGDGTTKQRKLQ